MEDARQPCASYGPAPCICWLLKEKTSLAYWLIVSAMQEMGDEEQVEVVGTADRNLNPCRACRIM